MSLGFLTESALLPSKAKAIKVDSKSLVDLRAVVFQKEQERQERQRSLRDALHGDRDDDDSAAAAGSSAGGTRGFGRFAHLKAAKTRGKALSKEEEKMGRANNRGVEKRKKLDEAARGDEPDERDDDKARHRKSRDMLEKKARLYDEMMSGRASGSGSSSAAAAAECLVDFGAKKKARLGASEQRQASESVEITDEFGRVRFVAKDSAEHIEFLELQSRKEADRAPPPVRAPIAQGSEQRQPPPPPSAAAAGSFVASQWEKRLNSQEKTYLQEVHESVGHAKSALLDKKTRKQLRLEKLRWRQTHAAAEAPRGSSSEPKADVQDEEAAAVKATEFLNQLGSLM